MPTTFVAVQCFQCSTMQVKQQKKSSNKWTCAVCNQKQSVRQVFAQGQMAKDLRKFVQSFNMSLKSADEQLQSLNPTQSPSELNHHLEFDEREDYKRKRRGDWTEYLDPEKGSIKGEDEGEDLGPKILTELPKEMFKRPKLKNYASQDPGQDENLKYKPVFRRRHPSKTVFMSQEKQAAKHQPAKVISGLKWSEYNTRDDKLQTTTSMPTVAKNTSKWKDYINQDENDSEFGNGRNSVGHMDEESHNLWDFMFDDQKVEDDIHPDFV